MRERAAGPSLYRMLRMPREFAVPVNSVPGKNIRVSVETINVLEQESSGKVKSIVCKLKYREMLTRKTPSKRAARGR